MAKVNHNQRTVKLLKEMGYTSVALVESYNAFTRRKNDLFGIFDFICVGKQETCAVQVTSRSNMASRVHKIEDSEHIANCRDSDWRILVIGWDKPQHRWRNKILDIS